MNRPNARSPLPDAELAERYRLAVRRIAGHAVCLLDPDGLILDWNDAAEAMKGYPAAEAVGRHFGMLYTDEDRAAGLPARNLEAAARAGSLRHEAWRRRKDGSLFWADVELIALPDPAGAIRGFCKLTQDLSGRKRLEDGLRRAQAESDAILDAAHAATWRWNRHTREIDVSPNFPRMLGYRAGEIGPADAAWAALVHPDDLAALRRTFADALAQPGDVPPVEFRLRLKDGQYRWFYTRPGWQRDGRAGGEPSVVSGVTVDEHERKCAEQERERLIDALAAERARALAILEQLPVSVVLADVPSGRIVHCNREAKKQFGPAMEALDRDSLLQCGAPQARDDGRPAPASPLARAMLHGETVAGEEFHCRYGGADRYYSVEAGPIRDADGVARVAVAVFTDVQAQKALQLGLATEKEQLQVTLASIGDAVVSTDTRGAIIDFNPAAERLTGWTRDEALGRPLGEVLDIVDEEDGARLDGFVAAALESGRTTDLSPRAQLRRRDGRQLSIEDKAAPIRRPDGSIHGLVIVFRDVTESRRVLRRLAHQATHDALTGLVNRNEFELRVQRALDRARSGRGEGALLYLDLDRFKIVNDSCGHQAGDELLRQLSQRFRTRIRERDTLARVGGDEFALLMEHCPLDEALRVANALLATTRDFRFPFDGHLFRVGVSIGLVPIAASSPGLPALLQHADQACYAAKEGGRDQVRIEPGDAPSPAQSAGDLNWVSRIADALRDDALQLFFQPIVPLGRRGGPRYEILLRLSDGPDRWITPGSFLPVAERHDLMPALDRWVLRRIADWLAAHPDHVAQLELCAINLSARTLADDAFRDYALDTLDASALPAGKLCFEIAESAALGRRQHAARFMEALGGRGCRFALDDFGAGIASFACVRTLPVDFIKLSGALIATIRDSAADAEMVSSMNRIGHLMGKQTVAEGVADDATLALLEQFGVDFVQGHRLGAPQPLPA